MKNDIKISVLRRGVIKGFDTSMKNEECKPNLKERLFRITSPEFQINHNAGLFLGRTVAENLKLAVRRNELAEFILKETNHHKREKTITRKVR